MIRDWAAMAAFAIVAAGCSFQLAGTTDGGGGDDAPDIDAPILPTVGFSQVSSTQDEASGALMIDVMLSPGAVGPVSVAYSFGGSATAGTDYVSAAGSLTFAIGETTKSIPVTIIADQVAESDETIVISLASPTAAVIGTATHTITIGANTLPRVNLSTPTSMIDEATAVTITLTLDKMANGPTTVTYTVGGGTAQPTGPFADYTLASGVVNFPTGSIMQTVPLGVVNDLRNELNETLEVTLTASTGVVIGTTALQTHTILNNDAIPSVQFAPATSMATEGNTGSTTTTLTVALSAASGRTVTVPFAVNIAGTSMTNPGDYTLVGSSLTFTEGVTSQNITVNVAGDTINETTEMLALALTAPADGSASLGSAPIGVLTITDNDPWCQGAGVFAVCYPTRPTAPLTLPSAIDTDQTGPCQAAQPTNWTAAQPNACVITATAITMSQNTVVTGSRPLVLVSDTNLTISFLLDVSSRRGDSNLGPASPSAAAQCSGFLQAPGAGGGGAGGSFVTPGGNGGVGYNISAPGQAALQVQPPTALRGGCHGQQGSGGDLTGKGGGAVYLVAGGTLTVTSAGKINASGSGAAAGGTTSGGSGGGSGGMIVLYASAITSAGAVLMANGGGGAGGGDNNDSGSNGADPLVTMPTMPAAGGPLGGGGGTGGNGQAGVPPGTGATNGTGQGGGNDGGGGGGGGGGYIRTNLALTGATVSGGRLDLIP